MGALGVPREDVVLLLFVGFLMDAAVGGGVGWIVFGPRACASPEVSVLEVSIESTRANHTGTDNPYTLAVTNVTNG